MALSSRYLLMRDGACLAVDVHLPPGLAAGRRVPTILHQTRYFRSASWRAVARRLGVDIIADIHARTRASFLTAGYAWIDVDVRGSGASTGTRPSPWWTDEVTDGAEVVDWIVAQPWSSGLVGTTGISYGGTCAEFLLTNRHPAVRAAVPRFSLFDVFTDVAFPGGIQLAWFTAAWARFNAALDRNAYHEALAEVLALSSLGFRDLATGPARHATGRALGLLDTDRGKALLAQLIQLAVRGVRRTDEDPAGDRLRQAVAEHVDNVNIHQAALKITHRDDVGLSTVDGDASIDVFSPHHYLDDLKGSGAAVFSYSAWLDGAYQHSAIKRHLNLGPGQSTLLIGPWEHGGSQDISPWSPKSDARFDHEAELLRFFDCHLKGVENGVMDEPPVRYFTLGQERWKTAERWPPPEAATMTWHLASGGELRRAAAAEAEVDRYEVDPQAGTGPRSRWRSLLGMQAPVGYSDRRRADAKLLCYTSAPLTAALEVTGHPIVRLFVSSSESDGALFAYLEDVTPSGRVVYVTEGQLRLLHRKLGSAPYRSATPSRSFEAADAAPLPRGEVAEVVFDLLPTSYQFARGHSLRLAVAGADKDHFATIGATTPSLRVHRGGKRASRIDLPVVA